MAEMDFLKQIIKDYEIQIDNLRKENEYLKNQLFEALEELEGFKS